jgi:hypothetical protein
LKNLSKKLTNSPKNSDLSPKWQKVTPQTYAATLPTKTPLKKRRDSEEQPEK